MYLAAFTLLALTNPFKEFSSGLASDPKTMVVYDDFNFLDRVRDRALGSSRNMMQNLTTSLLLRCEDYPDDGLTQSMHGPSHPLQLTDILRASGTKRDAISKQWSRLTRVAKFITRSILSLTAASTYPLLSPTLTF
jgi:hypothetical protein